MGYLRKDMVIDALKEDMEDTKKCYKYYQEKKLIEFCYNCMERAIDRLPQYYPENAVEESRWIPCSERLPEEPKENPVFDGKYLEVYLVTTKYGSNEQDKVYPFRAFWNGINFTDGWRILDVIAWMPLPEPYKE